MGSLWCAAFAVRPHATSLPERAEMPLEVVRKLRGSASGSGGREHEAVGVPLGFDRHAGEPGLLEAAAKVADSPLNGVLLRVAVPDVLPESRDRCELPAAAIEEGQDLEFQGVPQEARGHAAPTGFEPFVVNDEFGA